MRNSLAILLVFAILVPFSAPQLIPTETRVLFQAQKQLEYPPVLQGWTNWTNFCYLPPSNSLTIVCSNNRITELTIVGNKSSISHLASSANFSISNQTLSSSFSIDSFFTVLTKLSSLKSLSLVNLGIWGPLPAKVNRFRSLESLNLSSNFIYGEIPQSITTFKSLWSLVLAENQFNGSVPDLGTLSVLEELDLSFNLIGPEFPSIGSNNQLVNITLRSNKIAGPIPPSIFSLPSVEFLDLADNQLSGTIPANISCGANLTYVDLSHNRLIGKLPQCMASNSTNRTVISSWNCLSSGNLRNQHSLSYCQKEALAVQPSGTSPEPESRIKLGVVLGIIGGTVAITAALGLLILCIIRRPEAKSSDDKHFEPSFVDELSFRGSPKSSVETRRVPQTIRLASLGLPSYQVYTLEEIENATNNFDPCNLVTEASQGQIYKARLRDGSLVLVKCLKIKQRHLPQNLSQQMEMLSKLRHRHLVSVLGHCIVTYQDHPNISSTVFIVLEYVSNGSLKDHLTDWRKKEMLKWPQRMAITIGIARGVQFLHTGVAPGIFGNDLKIDNIQLDQSLTAKISSYRIPLPFKTGPDGLPNHQDSSDPPSSDKEAEKEDVFQLGIILLQVIVGHPVKSTSELDDMRQLLEKSLTEHPTQLRNATDPSIRGTYAYQSLKTTVEVTVNCLAKDPSQRPSIEDVLWNLQYSIQVQEGWDQQ